MKRRWKCYSGVDAKIFDILKSNKDITTSGVVKKLKDQKVDVTWKMVNSYLVEFEKAKKVKKIQIGDVHKINFWNVTAKSL